MRQCLIIRLLICAQRMLTLGNTTFSSQSGFAPFDSHSKQRLCTQTLDG
jgi:hypothetical protein